MNSNLQDTRLKIPQHLCKMLANEFFEIVPFNVAVIDKDSMIIIANKNFEDYFGNWVGKRCYEVYHHTEERCPNCKAKEVFEKGIAQVNDEGGYDRLGRTCHFVNHLAPVKDEKGVVQYVVEMCTDVVNSTMYQREYNILFERVPCYISIVDKEYRIVRANNKLRETFGEVQGKFCFEVFKKRKTPCSSCPAEYTFETGKESYSTEVGLSSSGEETHYVVNTSSFSSNSNGVSLILEIANDITEIALLQEQIKEDHDFYNTVLEDSKTAIIALNNRWKTQIFNAKAREILNWKTKRKPTLNILRSFLPKQFFEKPDEFGMIMNTKEIYLETPSGSEVPVLITALELKGSKNEVLGRVCFFEDISSNKVMSKQIEDSERFKIISQTVGGLSHTVRNLLISLEGSMFLVDSGLKKNDKSSVDEGWASLVQNYNKTSDTVK
ncbi:MAG: PAS domain-containing protein [Bacteroidota bacterium]